MYEALEVKNIDSLFYVTERLSIEKDSVIKVNKDINWKNYKLNKTNLQLSEKVNKGSTLKIKDISTSNSKNLSLLFAGDYVLTIVSNLIPGDTSSQLLCSNLDIYGNPKDTITIEETLKLEADFSISGQCNELDSADVILSPDWIPNF